MHYVSNVNNFLAFIFSPVTFVFSYISYIYSALNILTMRFNSWLWKAINYICWHFLLFKYIAYTWRIFVRICSWVKRNHQIFNVYEQTPECQEIWAWWQPRCEFLIWCFYSYLASLAAIYFWNSLSFTLHLWFVMLAPEELIDFCNWSADLLYLGPTFFEYGMYMFGKLCYFDYLLADFESYSDFLFCNHLQFHPISPEFWDPSECFWDANQLYIDYHNQSAEAKFSGPIDWPAYYVYWWGLCVEFYYFSCGVLNWFYKTGLSIFMSILSLAIELFLPADTQLIAWLSSTHLVIADSVSLIYCDLINLLSPFYDVAIDSLWSYHNFMFIEFPNIYQSFLFELTIVYFNFTDLDWDLFY